MYVAPNSTVRLCRGIPYDSSYEHTIYFSSSAEQITYFVSKTKYVLERNYYVRKERGTLKVKLPIGSCIDCNYMMYKNTSYENKWFYAFITDVEYVNNETTRIRFELDYIQTYLFDIDFTKKQFIERYTQPTDVAGDNLVPENFETGEYVTTGRQFTNLLNDMVYVLAVTVPLQVTGFDYDVLGGFEYNGVYSGLCYEIFTSADALGFAIRSYNQIGITKRIVGVFMMPKTFAENWRNVQPDPDSPVWMNLVREVSSSMTLQNITIGALVDTNKLDSNYTPRNKKLLTSPYNVLHVTNNDGTYADYGFEYFNRDSASGKITFAIGCTMTMPPIACCIPRYYKAGQESPSELNYKEMLVLTGFPQCSYNSDTFKAFLAQIALPAITNTLLPNATIPLAGRAMQTAMQVGSALNPAPVAPLERTPAQESLKNVGGEFVRETDGYVAENEYLTKQDWKHGGKQATIANIVGAAVSRVTNPPQSMGQTTRDLMTALGKKDFCFEHLTIKQEFAEIIDSYFDRFGYAYHRMDIVNLRNRPEWTYIKTAASDFHGNFPQDVARVIDSIFDDGITFWANSNHVGNYDLNNAPV